jgi:hypothetical protein
MNDKPIITSSITTKKENKTIFFFYKKINNYVLRKRFILILKELHLYNGNSTSSLSDKDFFHVELIYNSLINESLLLKVQRKLKKKKTPVNNKKNFHNQSVYDKLRNTKNIGKFIRIKTK